MGAKKSLDWYFRHEAREAFSIGFYGGEPLIAFPIIKRVVAYTRKHKGKAVRFNLTTNGTLLSEEISRFIIDEGFRILFSLDGPASVHNRYRVFRNGKGSYSRVWEGIARLHALDEEFFRENVSFNLVLAPPIELEAIKRFVDENPEIFKGNPMIFSGINTQSSRVFEQMGVEHPYKQRLTEMRESSQLFEEFKTDLCQHGIPAGFSRYYYGQEYVEVHQRSMGIMHQTVPSHGQCIPGKRKCFVSGDGGLYMCERVNPAFKIGDIRSGIDGKRVKIFLQEYNGFFKEQCSKCWAIRLCQKCYNNVRDGEEWSKQRGHEFCSGQRARIHHLLTQYCEIRECKDDAFQWTEAIKVV